MDSKHIDAERLADQAQTDQIDAEAFESLRRYLFTIAYRLVGSAGEAEDIVQDAFLRTREVSRTQIRSLQSYLATVVTRLSLDYLRSARAEREVYPGPWMPDPAPTEDLVVSPEETVEQHDQITLGFMLLLERLTPEERATYILREAFAYPHEEIAGIIGRSPAAVRQLAHRAKERITSGRPRFHVSLDDQRALVSRFLDAASSGDLTGLTELLAADVVASTDGGPSIGALRVPLHGREKVSHFIAGGYSRYLGDKRVTFEDVNGAIAILWWDLEVLVGVLVPELSDKGIEAMHFVLNPEKLAYLQRRLGSHSPN
jgi:RNA polymerase sigma-70 factor (ECF subfamily)